MSSNDNALDGFFNEGWIMEILFEVKQGKEATVYCCRAGKRAQHGGQVNGNLVAAKVYRPLETRGFRNDAVYLAGRVHMAREGRAKRAVQGKSQFGREVQHATWLDNEWETMQLLHDAGADVPPLLARSERAILMPYLGDETAPAPRLSDVEFNRHAAERVVDRLLWNIELMLHCHRVHGDLSPFNVLFWNDNAVIIDFPQAIDPRLNPAAYPLLARDVENICRWAHKCGVQRDAHAIAIDLWSRFIVGEIG